MHLGDDGARLARNLSYGEQRQLEIGIALAGEPEAAAARRADLRHVAGRDRADDRPDRQPAAQLVDPDDRARHEGGVLGRRPHHRALLRQGAGDRHAGRNPGQRPRARGLSRDERTDARAREHPRLLRRQPHPARRLARGRRGRGGLPARPQRRRQDHDDPDHHGLSAAAPRPHPLQRPRHRGAAALRGGAARRRLRAAGARDFPEPHGAREPDRVRARRRHGPLDARPRSSSCFPICRRASAISASSSPAASSRCCRSPAR